MKIPLQGNRDARFYFIFMKPAVCSPSSNMALDIDILWITHLGYKFLFNQIHQEKLNLANPLLLCAKSLIYEIYSHYVKMKLFHLFYLLSNICCEEKFQTFRKTLNLKVSNICIVVIFGAFSRPEFISPCKFNIDMLT